MRNNNHIYRDFRLILHTYGNIMRINNHIYRDFRLILHTYGIIMLNNIHIYIEFSADFRNLWNYNAK